MKFTRFFRIFFAGLLLSFPALLSAGTQPVTILGHTYHLVLDTIDSTLVKLTITNESGDSVLLDRCLLLAGGDCNFHSVTVTDYEIKGDRLILYTYRHDSDSYNYSPGLTTYTAIREEFVFQKSGRLVRIGYLEGAEGSALWKNVTDRLQKKIEYEEQFW